MSRVWLAPVVVLLTGILSSGCAGNLQTAAAATTAGLLGLGVALQAMTNSRLDVTVEVFAPTKAEQEQLRLGSHPALRRRYEAALQREADAVTLPTPDKMLRVAAAVGPIMTQLEASTSELNRSAATLRGLPIAKDSVAVQRVLQTFDGQRAAADRGLRAWQSFNQFLGENAGRLNDRRTLDGLARRLLVLRQRLMVIPSAPITQEYLDLLVSQLDAAMGRSVPGPLQSTLSSIMRVESTPAASPIERTADVLDAARRALALVPTDQRTAVDQPLRAFGFTLSARDLVALGSRDAILAALAPRPVVTLSPGEAITPAPPSPPVVSGPPAAPGVRVAPMPPSAPPAVAINVSGQGGFTPDQVKEASKAAEARTYVYSALIADFNSGPIANEVIQFMVSSKGTFGFLTDPANEARWHPFSEGRSKAGQGNHNSIVYMENMALPIVKSSAFDPTKFIVANAALYRRAFAVAADVMGAPAGGAGAVGGGAAAGSTVEGASGVNLWELRGKIQNDQQATTRARQKILDALKVAIDQDKGVQGAAADWDNKKADLLAKIEEALRQAATDLESVSGTP